MKFINREKELKALNDKWVEKKSQFFVIYGKRRVGKTELIKRFITNKPAIYFLADKRTVKEQLKELGRLIGQHFNDSLLIKQGFSEWLDVFQYLKEKNRNQFVLVVDEYPYLVEVDGSISSIFQKGWDEYLKDSQVFLIINGSSIAMMESEALLYKSPLFGRRTGQLLLKPLTFLQAWKFFPKKDFRKFLDIYAITGGMPAYLLQFDSSIALKENIKKNIFPKTSFLSNEVEFTLKEELREPKNYLSILRAISQGKRKFGEIVNETGLKKNVLMKYLTTLHQLQIIEKQVPATENNPQKSRKGLYKITDNFFRFWFQYIFPHKSDLEIENYSEVERKLAESFNGLTASTYESVCQEILFDLQKKIFNFEKVGKWWENEQEIDLVALNQRTKEIIFGECKWSEKIVGVNVYNDLKKKSSFVQWNQEKRKEYFILFSKNGFTSDMFKLAKKEKIFLVKCDRLV